MLHSYWYYSIIKKKKKLGFFSSVGFFSYCVHMLIKVFFAHASRRNKVVFFAYIGLKDKQVLFCWWKECKISKYTRLVWIRSIHWGPERYLKYAGFFFPSCTRGKIRLQSTYLTYFSVSTIQFCKHCKTVSTKKAVDH